MDVLVVVGSEPAPTRLEDRALHVHRFRSDEALATLVGALRRAGLPTELFTYEPIPPDSAETLTVSRSGASPTRGRPWTWPTPLSS